MKILLLSLIIIPNYFAQSPKANFHIHNCSPIKGDFLWAAQTEVSNFHYIEYLSYLRQNNELDKLKAMTPDTTVWRMPSGFSEKFVEYYFRHPAYRDFPVVGITQLQAEAYCEWLEERLNESYAKNLKHPVQKVDVRLPTEEEWKLAARGGDPQAIFPWKSDDMRSTDKKIKGAIQANYTRGNEYNLDYSSCLNINADITAPVKSYWPNAFGLYNMSGNVAEMLQEKGRTQGGSWASRAPYLEIDANDEYAGFTNPSPEIGFRYFIEVIDFKPTKQNSNEELTAKKIEQLLNLSDENSAVRMSQTEISNELYSLFVADISNKSHACKNELWLNHLAYSRRLVNDYTTLPLYKDYPVVNITKEDAEAFCTWLTEKLNQLPDSKYKGFTFRLPTENEWITAAQGKLELNSLTLGDPFVLTFKGEYYCNYNPVKDRWILDSDSTHFLIPGLSISEIQEAGQMDGYLFTAPIKSFNADSNGLYCMLGNVAEMVSDKNIVKGGSWGSLPNTINFITCEEYQGPSPYVGFRIVLEKPINTVVR